MVTFHGDMQEYEWNIIAYVEDYLMKVLNWQNVWQHIDGLVQERRNSSASAMELRLSCTNPSIWG